MSNKLEICANQVLAFALSIVEDVRAMSVPEREEMKREARNEIKSETFSVRIASTLMLEAIDVVEKENGEE